MRFTMVETAVGVAMALLVLSPKAKTRAAHFRVFTRYMFDLARNNPYFQCKHDWLNPGF